MISCSLLGTILSIQRGWETKDKAVSAQVRCESIYQRASRNIPYAHTIRRYRIIGTDYHRGRVDGPLAGEIR